MAQVVRFSHRPFSSLKVFSSKFLSLIFLLPEGAFVSVVMEGTPAAQGGLGFGDQILEVDQANLAGLNSEQVISSSLDFMLFLEFYSYDQSNVPTS